MQYKEQLEAALGKLPSPLSARVEGGYGTSLTIVLLRENKYRDRLDTVAEVYAYIGQDLADVMGFVKQKLDEEKEFKALTSAPDLEGGEWWN